MGASSLSEVFNRVSASTFDFYLMGSVEFDTAKMILYVLAEALMDKDWDTVDEAFGRNKLADAALLMTEWFSDYHWDNDN